MSEMNATIIGHLMTSLPFLHIVLTLLLLIMVGLLINAVIRTRAVRSALMSIQDNQKVSNDSLEVIIAKMNDSLEEVGGSLESSMRKVSGNIRRLDPEYENPFLYSDEESMNTRAEDQP